MLWKENKNDCYLRAMALLIFLGKYELRVASSHVRVHNNEYLQEPSLFAMTSLLETGVANLERIDLIWPPVTSHFIEVLYL